MSRYITIVYRLPEDFDVATLTSHENVSAMAWSHMMDERDQWEERSDSYERMFEAMKLERDRLAAENAELREVLQRIEGSTMSMYATYSDMVEHLQDLSRAALAKHKEATK